MSKQAKNRNKALAKKAARNSSKKGPSGASGKPHMQLAPPWVGNGTRKPKAVREREAKLQAEREAAEREASKSAKREAANA